MRKPFFSLAVGCALLLLSPVSQTRAQSAAADESARVIVKYKADSPLLRKDLPTAAAQRADQAAALGKRVRVALRTGAGVAERTQVVFATGMTSEELAQRLAAESDIEYAVPDRRRRHAAAPNDPLYLAGPAVAGTTGGPAVGQWYLRAPTGDVQSSINVEPAWDASAGGASIVVAVIDTGVRFDHPDLQRVAAGGNLLPGYDMISDAPTANDGDGRDADASDPGDWLTLAEVQQRGGAFNGCNTVAEDSSWHGTQTSALIGALTSNGIGMAGVGRNVRVLPVRVLGKCGGFDSDIIAAMLWAAGLVVPGVPANPNPARVLNLSLSGEGPCTSAYIDAVARVNAVGAVVVAAAGNSTGHAVGTPASCAGVIAVAGLRHVGSKVGFSDLGPEIAISAPGGNCVNIGEGEPCLYPILTAANSGLTVPVPDAAGGSIYTDSFNVSLGTSFSAPLVAGTAALMLSAKPALTPAEVLATLRASARPFPTTGGSDSDGVPTPQCVAPRPVGSPQVDQGECYCTTSTCGAGMLDAGAAVRASLGGVQAPANYQGLWWNAPAGSESGWGINLNHQGNTLFATWFTFGLDGKPLWLVGSATATPAAPNVFSGNLFTGTGPPFNAFDPGKVVATPVGATTITFTDLDHATLAYSVDGFVQTKTITREVFGSPVPTCVFAAQPNFALATNFEGLWWNAPPGSEPGWGINLTHQGNTIFATWFTFGLDGGPLWLVVAATRTAPSVYTGTLVKAVSGPAFKAIPFDPAQVDGTPTGNVTLTFTDGNTATFAYSIDGIAQTKEITREIFAAPGTICQ